MKAITYSQYGSADVLRVSDVPQPQIGADDVLVRVRAASVCAGDWHMMRGDPLLIRPMLGGFKGLLSPTIVVLGSDFAGEVEAVGAHVTRFVVGDAVYGDVSESGFGAFAEYLAAPGAILAHKPALLTFEEAAAVPVSGVTALKALRDVGKVTAGHRVLIVGASGGVGSFAAQIAKALGAHVTVALRGAKADMATALRADAVIDTDVQDVTGTGQYDLIIDAAAYRPMGDYRRALSPTGCYVCVGGAITELLRVALIGSLRSRKGGRSYKPMMDKPTVADLEMLSDLIEAGQVHPVIDRCFSLDDAADGIRHLEARRSRGKVVLVT